MKVHYSNILMITQKLMRIKCTYCPPNMGCCLTDCKFIEPYDLTLKTMSTLQKTAWSNSVIEQLKNEFDLRNDEFVILAGLDYYSNYGSKFSRENMKFIDHNLGNLEII